MSDSAHSLVESLCILCSNHTGEVDVDAEVTVALLLPMPSSVTIVTTNQQNKQTNTEGKGYRL